MGAVPQHSSWLANMLGGEWGLYLRKFYLVPGNGTRTYIVLTVSGYVRENDTRVYTCEYCTRTVLSALCQQTGCAAAAAQERGTRGAAGARGMRAETFIALGLIICFKSFQVCAFCMNSVVCESVTVYVPATHLGLIAYWPCPWS